MNVLSAPLISRVFCVGSLKIMTVASLRLLQNLHCSRNRNLTLPPPPVPMSALLPYPPLPDSSSDDEWPEPPQAMVGVRQTVKKQKQKGNFDPRARWRDVYQGTLKEGTFLPSAFPVVITSQLSQPDQWTPFQWDLIKELRKAVHDYGLQSPYMQGLLRNIFSIDVLFPYNCQQIAELVWTPSQKLLWQDRWHRQCSEESLKNVEQEQGDPLLTLPLIK